MTGINDLLLGLLAASGDIRTPSEVFQEIFTVFLVLGSVVGVVVIGYTLYNAYKYRDGSGNGKKTDGDRPQLGDIPSGGGGGKKLFVSFGISAIIVISLIIWTYGTLLYIESGPAGAQENALEIQVEGYQFGWEFQYPNGYAVQNELRVPADRPIQLQVTSRDVFHNLGIPDMRVKSDAIPGETTSAWFVAEETGTHLIQCYELCGAGHSFMKGELVVMEPSEYEAWYSNTGEQTNESALA